MRRNQPKNTAMTPPLTVFLAAFLLLLAGSGDDRTINLGNRDDRCALAEMSDPALLIGRESRHADQAGRLKVTSILF